MPESQEQYDDAMFAFSQGDYDAAIKGLQALLAVDPSHFDAQLALGMAHYRKGDYAAAIVEGHKAEKLRPKEQLAHTNLSLFYMKAGNKQAAEHHGLQARIAGWRDNMAPPTAEQAGEPELQMAKPKPPPIPQRDMPWKKNVPASPPSTQAGQASPSHPNDGRSVAMSEFVSVAEVDSLPPGSGRTVHVRGREFALWNLDGQFYCIDDQCPHRGGPLGAGTLQNGEVFCPLHGWGFDVRTGACSSRPDRPVKTYPTRIHEGRVQICV